MIWVSKGTGNGQERRPRMRQLEATDGVGRTISLGLALSAVPSLGGLGVSLGLDGVEMGRKVLVEHSQLVGNSSSNGSEEYEEDEESHDDGEREGEER
ncbi:hypothetical protein PMAYCL1PPCAC_30116, partial [Pristionchus mayeri]